MIDIPVEIMAAAANRFQEVLQNLLNHEMKVDGFTTDKTELDAINSYLDNITATSTYGKSSVSGSYSMPTEEAEQGLIEKLKRSRMKDEKIQNIISSCKLWVENATKRAKILAAAAVQDEFMSHIDLISKSAAEYITGQLSSMLGGASS